jgi:hypothetical protein
MLRDVESPSYGAVGFNKAKKRKMKDALRNEIMIPVVQYCPH